MCVCYQLRFIKPNKYCLKTVFYAAGPQMPYDSCGSTSVVAKSARINEKIVKIRKSDVVYIHLVFDKHSASIRILFKNVQLNFNNKIYCTICVLKIEYCILQ